MRCQRSLNVFILIILCIFLFLSQSAGGDTRATVVLTANIIQTPTAQFTANITAGPAPLPVEFTDLSSGVPTSWYWDFGDGTNSTDQNPTHTYASGIYTVNLTVANTGGNSTKVAKNYITALQGSTGPSQSPIPFSGGGGGGFNPGSPAFELAPPQPAQQNPQTGIQQPEQGPELAPLQGNLISQTIDLSPYSQYMFTDSSGRTNAIIDRAEAEQSGATVIVSGKTVEIISPAFALSITAGTMTEVNGEIRAANIQSILLASEPVEGYVEGIGQVTSSFTAGLASLPSNSEITTTIAEPVDPLVVEAFQHAVVLDGDEIQSIAYTMTIQKTNVAATLPATITMSVPAGWVTAHGGINAIVIGRIADDQTTTILKTSFSGYDQNGNMEFIADSPDGLSVFALIATNGPLQAQIGHPGFMTLILQNPVLSTILIAMNHSIGTTGGLVVVTLIILIVVLIAGGIIWRKRRTQIKKPGQQHNK